MTLVELPIAITSRVGSRQLLRSHSPRGLDFANISEVNGIFQECNGRLDDAGMLVRKIIMIRAYNEVGSRNLLFDESQRSKLERDSEAFAGRLYHAQASSSRKIDRIIAYVHWVCHITSFVQERTMQLIEVELIIMALAALAILESTELTKSVLLSEFIQEQIVYEEEVWGLTHYEVTVKDIFGSELRGTRDTIAKIRSSALQLRQYLQNLGVAAARLWSGVNGAVHMFDY